LNPIDPINISSINQSQEEITPDAGSYPLIDRINRVQVNSNVYQP